MTFDTFAYAEELKSSGFSEKQAVAITYGMVKSLENKNFDAPLYRQVLKDVGILENQVEFVIQGISDFLSSSVKAVKSL